jgi:hypothetical protein
MGPYPTESAAAGALALARERNEAWRKDNGED